jgi:chitin synthase
MNIRKQKNLIFTMIYLLNILLSTTFIYFEKYWYIYIILLGYAPLINSINVLYLWGNKIFTNKKANEYIFRENATSYVFIVPTYNESELELRSTLDSLTSQLTYCNDEKSIFIVCDGKVKGKGNDISTDLILINKIFDNNLYKNRIKNAYITWDGTSNNVDFYLGNYNNVTCVIIVKDKNYGKRDSLVLVRRLLYMYNEEQYSHPLISDSLLNEVNITLRMNYNSKIKYIIGTDADTVFEKNCVDELLKEMEKRPNTVGCVGFVDISQMCYNFSPFTLYQYAEYYFAQCLKRQQQALMTHKVNCLSGCVQILKICTETCGDKILAYFNLKPKENANIFDHIRSYASEDRNHVCLMLSEYPYVETSQTLFANAYTIIPMSFEIFFSQRRRWTLGTISNDLLILTRNGIKLYEKISAFANILTFILTPFIFVATIVFIKTIIQSASMLMLYLSIVIILPFVYALTIPLFIKQMTFRNSIYYVFSYMFYLLTNSFMNILINGYSLWNMDKLSWGKTRTVEKENTKENTSTSETEQNIDNNYEDEYLEIDTNIYPITVRETFV